MLDEREAFLRVLAKIGGWVALLEIDAMRILPTEAETLVPALLDEGLVEFDPKERLVRLTVAGLRRVTPAPKRLGRPRP